MRDWEIVTSITSTGRPEHTARVLSMCVHRTTGRDVPQPGVSAANGKATFSEYQESERQEGEDSSSPKGVSSSSPASRGIRSPIRGDRPRMQRAPTSSGSAPRARVGGLRPSLGVRLGPRSEARARPTSHGGQLRPLGTLRRGRIILPRAPPRVALPSGVSHSVAEAGWRVVS